MSNKSNKNFHTVRGYEIMGKKNKALSHSMEDYLEMIYRTSYKKGYIRINTLAELLNVQAPSATKMVQKMGQLGLISYEKYGLVTLTEQGKKIGKYLLKRHNIIERFLKNIGVSEDILLNVELIEHSVTADALNKMEILNKFFVSEKEIMGKFEEFKKLHKK